MREEKQIVREFYDTFGWHTNTDGIYKDIDEHVDMRPVMKNYSYKIYMRAKGFINPHGKYFLNAGSGAISHAEYLEYSLGYDWHICVDFSERALSEARSKLKDRGLFVKADLTNLPFKDGIFDATVAAHVVYHIPEDEQKSAIFELFRTLKKNANCVVIYTWPSCLLTNIAALFRRIIEKTKRLIKIIPGTHFLWRKLMNSRRQLANEDKPDSPTRPPLYYKPQDYHWIQKNLPDNCAIDIRCWSSIDINFTRTFVPNNFVGRLFLESIFKVENIFSHVMARIGRYPMIIIRKQ